MKYISMVTAAMMAMSGSSIADIDESIAQLKMNERIANFDVTHDKEMTSALRKESGFTDEIIQVAGSRMGLNVEAGIVYQLSAAFSLDDLRPVQSLVTDVVMKKPENREWFPVSVDEDKASSIRAKAYVFTDPTCGFCVKLHKEHKQHQEAGIQTVLIPWPRQGLTDGAPGYDQWVNSVCSANPGDSYQAMIEHGVDPVVDPSKNRDECKALVERGFMLGQEIGVTGTPYIYMVSDEGKVFTAAGYLPAAELAKNI